MLEIETKKTLSNPFSTVCQLFIQKFIQNNINVTQYLHYWAFELGINQLVIEIVTEH